MKQFPLQPLQRFAIEGGNNAAIRRPREIAHFSYDDQHRFHLDDRSLRYYYPPRIGADLSSGFETFQQLDDTKDDHLDSLLDTIVDLEARSGTQCSADIITWRGMMTKIMATPYDDFNGFEMNATRFQDTIYIEENHEHKLESRKAQQRQQSRPGGASQDLMSFWGYKFETLSLIPDQWDATSRDYIEGREDQVVNNHAQYCSVVKTGIGKSRLIIGGEVDALWDCRPMNKDAPINWVELKTSAIIRKSHDETKFQRKLLKFWIQSFLLGVPKIIVGFRNESGILQRIQELQTQDIPATVKRTSGLWDGNLCINFTAAFLDWLKETINSDGVWRIRRREKAQSIEIFKVEVSGHGDILSNEFVRWRSRNTEQQQQSIEAAKVRVLSTLNADPVI